MCVLRPRYSWMLIVLDVHPQKNVVNQWNHHVYGWLKNGNIPKCQLYGIGFITLIVSVIPCFTEWYIFELDIYIYIYPNIVWWCFIFFHGKNHPHRWWSAWNHHEIHERSSCSTIFIHLNHHRSSENHHFSWDFNGFHPHFPAFSIVFTSLDPFPRLPHNHPGTEAPQQLLRRNGELGVPSV